MSVYKRPREENLPLSLPTLVALITASISFPSPPQPQRWLRSSSGLAFSTRSSDRRRDTKLRLKIRIEARRSSKAKAKGRLQSTKSRAITKYLARKHNGTGTDLLRLDDLQESAAVEVWLEVESQQYHPAINPVVFESLIAPVFYGRATDEKVVADGVDRLGNVLDVYEGRLSQTKYLAGDFYSLADLHHLPYLHYLMTTPYKTLVEARPHVKAWWEEISSRPVSEKVRAPMSFTE